MNKAVVAVRALFLCLLLVAGNSAVAGSADISGSFSYETLSNGQVKMEIGRITNNSTNRITGTLHVTLRFTSGSSPFGSGYNVARASLAFNGGTGQLEPNEYFYGVVLYDDFDEPPPGTYYVHMFVSEYPNLDTALDYVTFSSTATIGGGGGGDGGGDGGGGDGGGGSAAAEMSGNLSWEIDGDSVVVSVDRIQNQTSNVTTGTLYVTLRFTAGSDPYGSGYNSARESLAYINGTGQLKPGASFTGVSFSTDFDSPPPGTYYSHVFISQYPDLDTVLDVVTFNGTTDFGGGIAIPGVPVLQGASNGLYGDRVALSWSAVPGATSYRVYRASSPQSQGSRIATVSGTAYDDYSAAQGTSYFYRVQACNSAGCSELSAADEGWRGSSVDSAVSREEATAIARLYAAAFDRFPKRDGLNFWIDNYARGQGMVYIASRFVESNEFRSRYGSLDSRGFVRQLFINILGREPASSGIQFWVQHLDRGVSRAKVLAELSASAENRRKTADYDLQLRSDGSWLFCTSQSGYCAY